MLPGLLGAIFNLVWLNAPKWLMTLLYVGLGWFAIVPMPHIFAFGGWKCVIPLFIGGLFYTVGALIYVLKRPNPIPNVFGYHEIFHTFVVIAAGFHYTSIALIL